MPPEGLELMTQNQFYIMTQEGIEPWTSVTQTLPAYSNHSSMDGGFCFFFFGWFTLIF